MLHLKIVVVIGSAGSTKCGCWSPAVGSGWWCPTGGWHSTDLSWWLHAGGLVGLQLLMGLPLLVDGAFCEVERGMSLFLFVT